MVQTRDQTAGMRASLYEPHHATARRQPENVDQWKSAAGSQRFTTEYGVTTTARFPS